MEKLEVKACRKCGGFSQFYHVVGDATRGYVKCERCGKKQRLVTDRLTAVSKWNMDYSDKGPKRIWDNYIEIGEVRKSDKIKFVVAAATRMGFRYLNIREFYLNGKTGEWKPGRDGITIPLRAALNQGEQFIEPYADLVKLMASAEETAAAMELMDENNAVWKYNPEYVQQGEQNEDQGTADK